MPSPIAVVGLPASGKSTLAAALGAALNRPVVTTDDAVTERFGVSIADAYLERSAAEVHDAELAGVERATGGVIVDVGSGAIDSNAIQQALRSITTVWVQVSPSVAAKRAGLDAIRPVSLGNIRTQWSRMAAQREPLFTAIADITVSGNEDVADMVTQVLAKLDAGES